MQSNSAALQPAVAVTEEAAAEASVAQATPAQDELSRISRTTQTSSNLPIYNHLVPTHNSIPVESTTLYPCQRHPLGFIATLGLSKAMPRPTTTSRTRSQDKCLPPTPQHPSSSQSPSTALTIPIGMSTNTTSPATISPTCHITTAPAMNALYAAMTAALCQDSLRKITQPSHAKLLTQEPISQNIYLSSLLSSLPCFYSCVSSSALENGDRETAHYYWAGPEAPTTPQELP